MFDTSDSCTEGELLRNMPQEFIDNHVTFHDIKDDGFPIKLFDVRDCVNKNDATNVIADILSPIICNNTENQLRVLKKKISEFLPNDFTPKIYNFDFNNFVLSLDEK